MCNSEVNSIFIVFFRLVSVRMKRDQRRMSLRYSKQVWSIPMGTFNHVWFNDQAALAELKAQEDAYNNRFGFILLKGVKQLKETINFW